MTDRIKLKCMCDIVEMYIDENGDVVFDGWDERTEMAFIGFGDEPSPCWIVARALDDDKLDELLIKQAEEGNYAIAEALTVAGADVNAKNDHDDTPLHYAAWFGDTDMAFLLLKKGAMVDVKNNYDGSTPLHNAAGAGHTAMALLLLKKGATINVKNNDGETPLHEAAMLGSTDTVLLLLERGAPVDAEDNDGWTPLHWAATNGHTDTVALLEAWGGKREP